MNKRIEIDDYTDDPYNWGVYRIFGSLNGSNNKEMIQIKDKFFAIDTQKVKFLHADTFTNNQIFMFTILLKACDHPINFYNVFLDKDIFFELVSNDKSSIIVGKNILFIITHYLDKFVLLCEFY
jgi:hypothetical protein